MLVDPPNTVPDKYKDHQYVFHNSIVFVPRLRKSEMVELAQDIADRLSHTKGNAVFMMPKGGTGSYAMEGGVLRDPEGDEAFFAELNSLSEIAEFTVIPFDSQVGEDKIFVWKRGQTRKWERVLCGGTCFNAPTKYVNEHNFDGHIVLTDMCAPKPKPSKCPRMWMTDSRNGRNPYFQTNERIVIVDK